MSALRFQPLGPLVAGQGSRSVLGLAIASDDTAQPCVIIWVPEEARKDYPLMERVKREVRHAMGLDHPHIVRVLGFEELDQGPARIVEFADGEPLRKLLDVKKPLPARIAARIVCDACTGANYAHIAGNDDGTPLVHGDLRPETLMVSFLGHTKVTGYGALAFAPRDMGGQQVAGRRAYSAPEQIIGGREAITVPTDVYLLGLTLYECLTGMVPWSAQPDIFDQAVLTHPLPPAPPGAVEPELEKVLQRACHKKAAERYPTPLALREAIEAAVGGTLATPEEIAAYLSGQFPEQESLRANRKHLIDSGLADFIRKQWAAKAAHPPAPLPAPPPASAPSPAPAPSINAPASSVPPALPPVPPPLKGAAVVVVDRVTVSAAHRLDQGPPPYTRLMPWLVIGGTLAVVAGLYSWMSAEDRPNPAQRMLAELEAARASDAGRAPARDASVAAAMAVPDAGAPEPEELAAAPDASRPAIVSVAGTIESRPAADLTLDGVAAGKTPWSGRLTAGRHTVRLENKDEGLLAQRVLVVRGDEAVEQVYAFEKGYVSVNAPEGAGVFIDGIRKGTAPITGEIPVLEGSHRIEVRVGQAKWNQAFTLDANQRVSFNVNLE